MTPTQTWWFLSNGHLPLKTTIGSNQDWSPPKNGSHLMTNPWSNPALADLKVRDDQVKSSTLWSKKHTSGTYQGPSLFPKRKKHLCKNASNRNKIKLKYTYRKHEIHLPVGFLQVNFSVTRISLVFFITNRFSRHICHWVERRTNY